MRGNTARATIEFGRLLLGTCRVEADVEPDFVTSSSATRARRKNIHFSHAVSATIEFEVNGSVHGNGDSSAMIFMASPASSGPSSSSSSASLSSSAPWSSSSSRSKVRTAQKPWHSSSSSSPTIAQASSCHVSYWHSRMEDDQSTDSCFLASLGKADVARAIVRPSTRSKGNVFSGAFLFGWGECVKVISHLSRAGGCDVEGASGEQGSEGGLSKDSMLGGAGSGANSYSGAERRLLRRKRLEGRRSPSLSFSWRARAMTGDQQSDEQQSSLLRTRGTLSWPLWRAMAMSSDQQSDERQSDAASRPLRRAMAMAADQQSDERQSEILPRRGTFPCPVWSAEAIAVQQCDERESDTLPTRVPQLFTVDDAAFASSTAVFARQGAQWQQRRAASEKSSFAHRATRMAPPSVGQLVCHPLALLHYVPKNAALFLAGAFAGAFAKTLTAPLDRVKLLLQVQSIPRTPGIAVGKNLGFLEALAQIRGEGGLAGYWKGNVPQVIRVVPYSAVQLCAYETFKRLFKGRSKELCVPGRLVAGACAGMTSTLRAGRYQRLSTPEKKNRVAKEKPAMATSAKDELALEAKRVQLEGRMRKEEEEEMKKEGIADSKRIAAEQTADVEDRFEALSTLQSPHSNELVTLKEMTPKSANG
ncbi:hypothetical protein CBR_g32124 [Chara braunii]|uniref:Uncharacterized protein n=1 Tax=Chara braunii TaxID=69332 RepID=A0A388LGQ4_CHABU|nr:hypothetical protein CBR_g32124 [Chara braunii]|eukprot:GBG81447.1 hypothetical protein CBR_g32124 [Chara braunii]